MNRKVWAEVLPQPDWKTSSEPIQAPHKAADCESVGPSDWPKVPGASMSHPTPSSTRYVIVSTNNSWRHYIICTWKPDKTNKSLQKNFNTQKNEKTRKPIRDQMQKAVYAWYSKRCRWIDGRGPIQARRPVRINGKGPKQNWRICDLAFAASF